MRVKATVTTWWSVPSEIQQRVQQLVATGWPSVELEIRAIWAADDRRMCAVETDRDQAEWLERIRLLVDQAADELDDEFSFGPLRDVG